MIQGHALRRRKLCELPLPFHDLTYLLGPPEDFRIDNIPFFQDGHDTLLGDAQCPESGDGRSVMPIGKRIEQDAHEKGSEIKPAEPDEGFVPHTFPPPYP